MMNERIWELWHQATLDPTNEDSNDLVRRFAQLIVRECADVAADHEALDIYEEIREHFGVE